MQHFTFLHFIKKLEDFPGTGATCYALKKFKKIKKKKTSSAPHAQDIFAAASRFSDMGARQEQFQPLDGQSRGWTSMKRMQCILAGPV